MIFGILRQGQGSVSKQTFTDLMYNVLRAWSNSFLHVVSASLSLSLCLFISVSVCLCLSPPTISSLAVISTVLRIRLCKEAAVKPPQINLCATDGGYCRCQQLLKVQIADRCGVFRPKRDNYITSPPQGSTTA